LWFTTQPFVFLAHHAGGIFGQEFA
jgi:hypothetical protein